MRSLPASPQSLPRIDAFIDALWLEDGLSSNTLAAYRRDLAGYSAWLDQAAPGTGLDGTVEHHLQGRAPRRGLHEPVDHQVTPPSSETSTVSSAHSHRASVPADRAIAPGVPDVAGAQPTRVAAAPGVDDGTDTAVPSQSAAPTEATR